MIVPLITDHLSNYYMMRICCASSAGTNSSVGPKVQFFRKFCVCFCRKQKVYLIAPAPKNSKKTLILDLDETLVHSSLKPTSSHEFTIQVKINESYSDVYVATRPHLREFLARAAEIYEVIIFTAGLQSYAKDVVDIIDCDNVISHRLYRESCTKLNDQYIKDLSALGRNLDNVVIVDNSPISYQFQPDNAVPIKSWLDNPNDDMLVKVMEILEGLVRVKSIPRIIKKLKNDTVALSKMNILKYEGIKGEESKGPNDVESEKPSNPLLSSK